MYSRSCGHTIGSQSLKLGYRLDGLETWRAMVTAASVALEALNRGDFVETDRVRLSAVGFTYRCEWLATGDRCHGTWAAISRLLRAQGVKLERGFTIVARV